MDRRIPVVFCFSGDYAKYTAVSLFSLLLHARRPTKIYCLAVNADDSQLAPIARIATKFNAELEVIQIAGDAFGDWQDFFHLSRATYLRILIPDVVPAQRAIYLDSDLIVTCDISPLLSIGMDGCCIAGVADPIAGASSKIPRIADDRYLNAGVLLMDLEALRAKHFVSKCKEIYWQHERLVTWADQCVINKFAEGNKKLVSKSWNVQTNTRPVGLAYWEREIAVHEGAGIIHFTGAIKPWYGWCNPWPSRFWWSYAKLAKIPGIKPIEPSTIDHALYIAAVLDQEGDHQKATQIKSEVRQYLARTGNRGPRRGDGIAVSSLVRCAMNRNSAKRKKKRPGTGAKHSRA
jgi:lipopolysaccharide biosynthesis glycosyltransferase